MLHTSTWLQTHRLVPWHQCASGSMLAWNAAGLPGSAVLCRWVNSMPNHPRLIVVIIVQPPRRPMAHNHHHVRWIIVNSMPNHHVRWIVGRPAKGPALKRNYAWRCRLVEVRVRACECALCFCRTMQSPTTATAALANALFIDAGPTSAARLAAISTIPGALTRGLRRWRNHIIVHVSGYQSEGRATERGTHGEWGRGGYTHTHTRGATDTEERRSGLVLTDTQRTGTN